MAGVAPGAVQEWIDRGRMVRWEADGAAVAMAGLTRAVAGVRLGWPGLYAAGQASPRLCRGGHGRGESAGAGPGGRAGGPVHRPGQPDKQRPLSAHWLSAGRGSPGAELRIDSQLSLSRPSARAAFR